MQLLKKKMLCIPGLGGHRSVFAEYVSLLPGYEMEFVELVDRRRTLAEARAALSAASGPVILFCHCYSAQMGIQLAAEMPEKISQLIFLEPFFVELQPWMKLLLPVGWTLLRLSQLFEALGLRRRRFTYQPDYVALAKYPIYFQPFFDMRWQNLTDYFDKCYDILTYKLPQSVKTPTLMIFSSNGYTRDPAAREHLRIIFSDLRVVETPAGSHNVISMSPATVAGAIRESLTSAA